MKIIMTKGLPGSGKSTWAKEYQSRYPGTVRVNKDELRAMLHNSVHSKGRENFIIIVRNRIIVEAINRGNNVIVDDTNYNPIHEKTIRELAKQCCPDGTEVEIKDFSDVPLDTCIARDAKRPNPVGWKVIHDMHAQYLKPEPPVVEYVEGLPRAIICDLDGTLCLFGKASPYDRDFSLDAPNEVVMKILNSFISKGVAILFTSGRKDKFRDVTNKWITDHGFNTENRLFMRKDGDSRKDFEVKKEIYENEIKGKYNIEFVLDDRNQVVELWRSLGLTCLQVAPGDF